MYYKLEMQEEETLAKVNELVLWKRGGQGGLAAPNAPLTLSHPPHAVTFIGKEHSEKILT